ncbi:MAG: ribonuclease P protein component [Alphaproteobacteria bacterium]|nr:ribonuclease P protein component [Alphaproteobacteria bacterium]MBP7759498.1 ribonuclease P protein component [Alphaproteobacteria bacterium]MBP7762930.1 ribonuclease P protein component [Alphaproteobacteria bacterium]MBP7905206.1 ribonuclease P protein component [Alphaproteobacteria bacterium]
MHATKEQLKSFKTLKKRADFLKMRAGRKWVSHGLILQICENTSGEIRVGFTVTKKTDKSAVGRNRIKRRLRAVAADILPLYARTGVDYVLIGREQTATRPYHLLQNDLKWCLQKTGYLKEE